MSALKHSYRFDPSYGYSLADLLAVGTAEEPEDFAHFWVNRYARAMLLDPQPVLEDLQQTVNGWRTYALGYTSTDGMKIRGWCLVPEGQSVERLCVVMHGYAGRDGPDYNLPFANTALIFPCTRGISRSPHPRISPNPAWHVLHNIHDPRSYVLGGCVEDVWLAVSAGRQLFPQAEERVGLLGISFGGGIGVIALGFDPRIARAHFNVPSFGNQALRLTLDTTGSGAAVRAMHKHKPEVVEKTLGYYDAASAARRIRVPVHFACALFDPMVAPPGQFAIYNAVRSEKNLYVLTAGHFEYPEQNAESTNLLHELTGFFDLL